MNLSENIIEMNGDGETYHFTFSKDNPIYVWKAGNVYAAKCSFNGQDKIGKSHKDIPSAIFNLYIEYLKID
jgi:hypothetical protein